MKKSVFTFLAVLLVMAFLSNPGFAQEDIGGPYTEDANTMLLLHFDGDLTNSSTLTNDATGYGSYSFMPSAYPELGQSLYLSNDSETDSTYLTVAADADLDLQGDWTMESWLFLFTYGTSGSHRWVPRIMIKTGTSVFWQPNYFVELWSTGRFFSCGYYDGVGAWPQANSADNFVQPGEWVHMTFIRDTTRHLLITMIHNNLGELLTFSPVDYTTFSTEPPAITTSDLHIGWAGGDSGDSWLDGVIDEMRISNIVRDFPVPPIITNVPDLPNFEATVTGYEVTATIQPFSPTGSISSATIKYSVDGGMTWSDAAMSNTSGNDFAGTIGQLPLGSVVDYYVEAEDNNGLVSRIPIEGNPYYQFAIYQPNDLVLHLDFEEGSGVPMDKSGYNAPVTTFMTPVYSNDVAPGLTGSTNSLYMEPDADSAFIEVNSPFLTSKEFNVSFWFKADSLEEYTRILNRPLVSGNWWQNNYSIRTAPGKKLQGRYYADPDSAGGDVYPQVDLPTGDSIAIGTWYKVELKRDSEWLTFTLYDEDGNEIESGQDSTIGLPPIQPNAPLRIGNGGNLDGSRGFRGRIDEVMIYNNVDATDDVEGDNVNQMPETFSLSQNYPNPFNPTTMIEFSIPQAENVTLEVYDILGRKVKTLVNERLHVGNHEVSWDGTNDFGVGVSSGIYFYKLHTSQFTQTKKMTLMR